MVALQPLLPTVATSMARSISWSGYTWDVRPGGFGEPGPNQWSDSDANVRVDGSDLVLSIVQDSSGRWTSAEVDNQQHLGYGTYRWVVQSDLSALDANEVLGMFTYGGTSPSNNEIDFEPSHWGHLAWPTGSATVWQDASAGLNQSKTFDYTSKPPYVHQFTWMPGAITYLVTDAAGATLFSWTVTSGVPTPSSEVPIVNYWRFANAPPAAARSMRLSSFTWLAPGHEQDVPSATSASSGPGTTPASLARSGCTIAAVGDRDGVGAAASTLRIGLSRTRFPVTGRRAGASLVWTASDDAALRLVVQRRVRGRFAAVGSLKRSVHAGAGRIRFTGRVAGRRLRPGAYRLVVEPATSPPGCALKTLRFTVVAP